MQDDSADIYVRKAVETINHYHRLIKKCNPREQPQPQVTEGLSQALRALKEALSEQISRAERLRSPGQRRFS